MERFRAGGVFFVFSLIGLGLVLFAAWVLLGAWGLCETTHRADRPLSLESARKDLWIGSLPFPPSSKDIYYFYHAGGMQEFEFAVRFTVASKDLDEAVKSLLQYHDQVTKRANAYISAPIEKAPSAPDFVGFGPMPWWGPTSVSEGYYRGADGKNLPFGVWVDVPRHIVYLSETD